MKQLWSWLRVMAIRGDFPIPTSEAAYNAHLGLVDVALPLNGGKLQQDGTWLQQGWKINPAWPQSIPGLAASAGQLYIPMVECDRNQITTVLDSPTLQETAASNLVSLATSGRFDSPWDGVFLDLEGIPSAYKPQLSNFLLLLSYRIRKAGLICAVSVRGKANDPGPDYDDAYSYDFRVVAQAADCVDLRLYGYWNPAPTFMHRSMCPHWWAKKCIQYALSQGIPAQRLLFGLGNYSDYYPNSNDMAGKRNITHASAMQLAADANTVIEWQERNEYGLVRERIADLGPGHIWIHDGDTIRHNLDLVNEFGLAGIALFAPSTGDVYHWQVIEDWKG